MTDEIFYGWQHPQELLDAADALGDRLGNRAMRGGIGSAFREAFIASRFALHLDANAVRLLPPRQQPTPDFAILVGDIEKWYETTEADRPGRRRMDEYADGRTFAAVERIPDEHWVEPEDYASLIRSLTARKAAKRYDRCDGLIVWSNAFPVARQHVLDSDWWSNATSPAQLAFSEIWYHFQSGFYQVEQQLLSSSPRT